MQWNSGLIGYVDRVAFFACLVSVVNAIVGLLIPATRAFCGSVLYLASFMVGLDVWLISLATVYQLWGTLAVIIGLFLAGVGVTPMAFVALAFHREWSEVGYLLLNIGILLVLRIGGQAMNKSGERRALRKFV